MTTEIDSCGAHHCMTCGDDGSAMTVVRIDLERQLALCESPAGERSTVEIALLADPAPGDRVLVHAGTAIAALPTETAR